LPRHCSGIRLPAAHSGGLGSIRDLVQFVMDKMALKLYMQRTIFCLLISASFYVISGHYEFGFMRATIAPHYVGQASTCSRLT